jgi:hypothetical protein
MGHTTGAAVGQAGVETWGQVRAETRRRGQLCGGTAGLIEKYIYTVLMLWDLAAAAGGGTARSAIGQVVGSASIGARSETPDRSLTTFTIGVAPASALSGPCNN